MIVCLCEGVTERKLADAFKDIKSRGYSVLSEVTEELIEKTKAGQDCGSCKRHLEALVQKLSSNEQD